MRVSVDAGADSDHHALGLALGSGGGFDEGDLAEVVDDDAADAGLDGERELVGAFVVAVEVDGAHVDASSLENGDLSAGDGVEAEALVRDVAGEGAVEEGLRGVEDLGVLMLRAEGAERPLALAADGFLVVDVERRAVLAGELGEVTAANLEVAGQREPGGDWEQVGERQGGCRRGLGHVGPRVRGRALVQVALRMGSRRGTW